MKCYFLEANPDIREVNIKRIAMIVVHHLNNSRPQRLLWLLEEIGLDYEIKRYQRDPETMLAPPSLRAIHQLGKSPVVTDGDLTFAEPGAMVEYLVERYGNRRFAPDAGTTAYLRYRSWLHYAEGSLMSPLLLKLVFDQIEKSPMPFFAKPFAMAISGKEKVLSSCRNSSHTLTTWERNWIRAHGLSKRSFSLQIDNSAFLLRPQQPGADSIQVVSIGWIF